MAKPQRGYRTIRFPIKSGEAAVYTSPRTADALEDMVTNASLYDGVKLIQVMEAVYAQGRKDGAREAFDQIDGQIESIKKSIPHRAPGRPRKP
ncbi:MAG TPA: hypothetical protein VK501_19900 [Baekduia sp.]|uniref:hypothetical protein n=1 Tax=Baekduia sp. TaxID=2600305 RepID=UPI002C103314|nr:hypothetical protein [Baekduia sp.]HMJ36174.1 hypothetical protein [Baekduia sp.]